MSSRPHRHLDAKGNPIFGAPTAPALEALRPLPSTKETKRQKRLSEQERRFLENANKPVNWAESIRTARYNAGQGYVSIERLYQAFKTRLLEELQAHVTEPPNIGARLPLINKDKETT